jgi:hypothetical protein
MNYIIIVRVSVVKQINAIREAFINFSFFAKEEKENNRFAHNLWQSLQDGDISYRGIKIPIKMLTDSPDRRAHFSFPFYFPFNNILSLQAIDQYCQDIFENIHFEAYWRLKGMVCF